MRAGLSPGCRNCRSCRTLSDDCRTLSDNCRTVGLSDCRSPVGQLSDTVGHCRREYDRRGLYTLSDAVGRCRTVGLLSDCRTVGLSDTVRHCQTLSDTVIDCQTTVRPGTTVTKSQHATTWPHGHLGCCGALWLACGCLWVFRTGQQTGQGNHPMSHGMGLLEQAWKFWAREWSYFPCMQPIRSQSGKPQCKGKGRLLDFEEQTHSADSQLSSVRRHIRS